MRSIILAALLVSSACRAPDGADDYNRIEALIAHLRGPQAELHFALSDPAHLGEPGDSRRDALGAIIASGSAALPNLLAHLDDARLTGIVFTKLTPLGGVDVVPIYDDGMKLRYLAERKRAPSRYNVTIGDLCFLAIGKIVHRSFAPVRYQPTECNVISSPTLSPELAAEVWKEWGNRSD